MRRTRIAAPAEEIRKVDRQTWSLLLRCMLLARRTEERLIRLYHQGRIFGGVYAGIGQEAIGAATTLNSRPEDLFSPLIRDMTVHIGRGETVLNIFRQYLGRATGPTGGRDGNVHYGNLSLGVLTMVSHLGAMLPVIVGAVIARRRRGSESIGFAYFGDGASSTGDFHEALNFASVMDVPVVFVLENNQYAYSTPVSRQYRCRNLADRAVGYGMEGYRVDGNDAVGLYLFVQRLSRKIRHEARPVLLECETMRMRGHGEHDDFSYVPKSLLRKFSRRDPIVRAVKTLVEAGVISEEDFSALDGECRQEVDRAYRRALAEPEPDPATLEEGVYAPRGNDLS
ncbi:MAG TPA: thiamine pyrophosphate-dependent dehydrogenase E1 component subunit alpha [Kiritimatiellae bacterium]|nr:thiamine pyrophosphate-dependent dehydrogenase E1 component subunit alpha [Kiritimatiellia bacterium]